MALASALAFLPELLLPLYSYAAHGYLTPDLGAASVTVLPCASLAFALSLVEARRLWLRWSYHDLLVVVGLTGLGLSFATFAAVAYLFDSSAPCYGCDVAWFFSLAFPALVLEFVAGVVWLTIFIRIRSARQTSVLRTA